MQNPLNSPLRELYAAFVQPAPLDGIACNPPFKGFACNSFEEGCVQPQYNTQVRGGCTQPPCNLPFTRVVCNPMEPHFERGLTVYFRISLTFNLNMINEIVTRHTK